MKLKSRIKNTIFILFLLFAVFGIFFMFIIWANHKKQHVPLPSASNYEIKATGKGDLPDNIHYDFEGPQPKEAIFSNIAHSGQQSLCANGQRSFTSAVNIPVSTFDSAQMCHIALSAWVNIARFNKPLEAFLAFIVTDPMNDVLFSKLITLKGNDYEQGKWFPISTAFNTEEYKRNKDDRIRIYLWNNSDNDILLDDLDLFLGQQFIFGDSVYTDINGLAPYRSVPNIPPYPPFYLQKEDIGNGDSEYLINTNNEKTGSFASGEILLAGNFIHPYGSSQELLSLSNDSLVLYWYQGNEKRFRAGSFTGNLIPAQWKPWNNIIKGDFDGDRYDELFVVKKNSDSLLLLDQRLNEKRMVSLSRSWCKIPDKRTFVSYHAYDADKNGTDELLAVDKTGHWTLYVISNKGLLRLPVKNNMQPQWNRDKYEFNIVTGIADNAKKCDEVLTVFREKSSGKCEYSMLKYDKVKGDFMNAFLTPDGAGKIIGIDSLKVTDVITAVQMYEGSGIQLLRDRREWRFDLKLLEMNDTAYNVIGNIDFTGYIEDNNPKYQENVQVIPGNFISPDRTSLLVIARHKKGSMDKATLPNTVQIYSPQWK
jgi:hypothetical protein